MFATWRCTVWGLRIICSAISRSLSPCATSLSTSRSRRDSSAAAGSPSAGRSGELCAVSTARSALTTEPASPAHGKWALPPNGTNVAPLIPAATSRPSRYGIARSSRRWTTIVGAQPLKPREPFLLLAAALAEENVRQEPRSDAPVRADGRDDRLAHRRRRDRGAFRVGTVEHQTLDSLGKTRGERDRGTPARGAAE